MGGTSGYAVGSKFSVADLTIYYFLNFFFDNKVRILPARRLISAPVPTRGSQCCFLRDQLRMVIFFDDTFARQEGAAAAYASLPKIKAIVAAVAAHEGVKAWEAKRPVTPF